MPRRTLRLLAPAECWHLLSLDAPSVATLWAWSFARVLHLTLAADSLLLLFAGTWLLYIADRILDGLNSESEQHSARLRERHLFYIRHRAAAAVAAVPVTIFLVWLVSARIMPIARRADLLIFAVAAAYFCIVHLRGRAIERWFPKELIVALIFASATAVPAYARLAPASAPRAASTQPHAVLPALAVLATLFAALCWLNCVAIEKWEHTFSKTLPAHRAPSHNPQPQSSDRTTRWGQSHLRPIGAAITLAAILAAAFLRANPAAVSLCLAVSLSSALFIALDRRPLNVFHLRIAADAALLTPLLLVLIR
jgi:hypothetical protein